MRKILAIATLLAATSSAVAVKAEIIQVTQLAQFPGISLPGVSGDSNKPPENKPANQEFKGFSGNYTDYSDTFNGFKLRIPAEFKLNNRGATTDWSTTAIIDGGAASIYINSAPLKGVPSKVVYDANFKSKKEDRNYTEVVPVTVKHGNKTAYAFRCKEANHKPGSPEEKDAGDIHRWHLFVFDNQMVYTMGFTGTYAAFKGNKLQSTFEPVIKSVEIIPIQ